MTNSRTIFALISFIIIIIIITSGPAPAPGKINDILFFVDNKTKLVYKLGSKMISFFYSLI
jgi:hypothetical protein